eukprot:g5524.t1
MQHFNMISETSTWVKKLSCAYPAIQILPPSGNSKVIMDNRKMLGKSDENKTSPAGIRDVDLGGFQNWQDCVLFLKSAVPALTVADAITYCVANGFSGSEAQTSDDKAGGNNTGSDRGPTTRAVKNLVGKNKQVYDIILDVCVAFLLSAEPDSLDLLKAHWKMWKHDRGMREGFEKREWPCWCEPVMRSCLIIAETWKNTLRSESGNAGNEAALSLLAAKTRFLDGEKGSMNLRDEAEEQATKSNFYRKPPLRERTEERGFASRLERDVETYCRGIRDLFAALDLPQFEKKVRTTDAESLGKALGLLAGSSKKTDPDPDGQHVGNESKVEQLLASALGHFITAIQLSSERNNLLLTTEAMSRCLDIFAALRRSPAIAATMIYFRDRIANTKSPMKSYMMREVMLDIVAFHRQYYQLADARNCLEIAREAFREGSTFETIRFEMFEARMCIDGGDYPQALKLVESLAKQPYFYLELATKGRLGCFGESLADPLSCSESNDVQQMAPARTEVLLHKIFLLSDLVTATAPGDRHPSADCADRSTYQRDALRVLDNEFQYMPIGHREMARAISIPSGYKGPLDQETVHSFMVDDPSTPSMTMGEIRNRVKELDKAGKQRMEASVGVTDEEIAILRMWIMIRDPIQDSLTITDIETADSLSAGNAFRKSFRQKYSSVSKIEMIFEGSWLKIRRYKKLVCEIMAMDCRRRWKKLRQEQQVSAIRDTENDDGTDAPAGAGGGGAATDGRGRKDGRRNASPSPLLQDAICYYQKILHDGWCHVTAYNLLSVARLQSSAAVQASLQYLLDTFPFEMQIHQYFPLLYLTNEVLVSAAKDDADGILLRRINKFADVHDTPLWKFRTLVGYAYLKQARDWLEGDSPDGDRTASRFVDRALALTDPPLPEAVLYKSLLDSRLGLSATSTPIGDGTASAKTPHAPAAAGGSLQQEASGRGVTSSVQKPFEKSSLVETVLPPDTTRTGHEERCVAKMIVEEDVGAKVESSADLDWLLLQIRLGNQTAARVNAMLARMSKAERNKFWRLSGAGLESAIEAHRPVVDLHGKEVLPSGYYVWNLPTDKGTTYEYHCSSNAAPSSKNSSSTASTLTSQKNDSSLDGGSAQVPAASNAEAGESSQKEDESRVLAVCEQPTYFGVIAVPSTKFYEEYAASIEQKGFCSRMQKANGIKFDHSLVKVKINRDHRLWTDVIYKNKFLNYLMVFDHEDDHKGVERAKRPAPLDPAEAAVELYGDHGADSPLSTIAPKEELPLYLYYDPAMETTLRWTRDFHRGIKTEHTSAASASSSTAVVAVENPSEYVPAFAPETTYRDSLRRGLVAKSRFWAPSTSLGVRGGKWINATKEAPPSDATPNEEDRDDPYRVALLLCGTPEKRFLDFRGERAVNYEEMWSVDPHAQLTNVASEVDAQLRIQGIYRFRRGGFLQHDEVEESDLVTFDGQFEHLDRCFRAVRQFEKVVLQQNTSSRSSSPTTSSSSTSSSTTSFTHFIRARPDLVFHDEVAPLETMPADSVAIRGRRVVSTNPGLYEDATPVWMMQQCADNRKLTYGELFECMVPTQVNLTYAMWEKKWEQEAASGAAVALTPSSSPSTSSTTPASTTPETLLVTVTPPSFLFTLEDGSKVDLNARSSEDFGSDDAQFIPTHQSRSSHMNGFRAYLHVNGIPLCGMLDDQFWVVGTALADAVFLDGRVDRVWGRDLRHNDRESWFKELSEVEVGVSHHSTMGEGKLERQHFLREFMGLLPFRTWRKLIHDPETKGIQTKAGGGATAKAGILHSLDPLRLEAGPRAYHGGRKVSGHKYLRDVNRTSVTTSSFSSHAQRKSYGRKGHLHAMERCEPYLFGANLWMQRFEHVVEHHRKQLDGKSDDNGTGSTSPASSTNAKPPPRSRRRPSIAFPFSAKIYDKMHPMAFADREEYFTWRTYSRNVPFTFVGFPLILLRFLTREVNLDDAADVGWSQRTKGIYDLDLTEGRKLGLYAAGLEKSMRRVVRNLRAEGAARRRRAGAGKKEKQETDSAPAATQVTLDLSGLPLAAGEEGAEAEGDEAPGNGNGGRGEGALASSAEAAQVVLTGGAIDGEEGGRANAL